MTVPILIVIPYWKGDLEQARELCKIIVGLQPHHAEHLAHVMLACRQDSKTDGPMVKLVSTRFNVRTYQTQSPLRGWPAGANGMFGSTMRHVGNNFSKLYECVYWLEPDCVPIKPNWFWDLVLEWRKKHPSANIIGCRADCDGNGKGDHITGCALYHPNIAKILPCITTCDGMAWDYQHRAKIVAMGGHTNLIQNRYKQTNIDRGVIEEPGVVIIHGVKDRSVSDAVKRKFTIK